MAASRKKSDPHFSPEFFKYLRSLKRNNNKPWFEKNKARYQEHVRDPMLRFIADFAPRLQKISPHLVADPRPSGGSMFRIHRDVRFSKDKSPYKTGVSARFMHERGKEADAPGFYVHLGADSCIFGAGLWHPEGPALNKIRKALVADPAAWRRAQGGKAFKERFVMGGESLKRPPKGFDAGHPLIEDLKRKDFVVFCDLDEGSVCSSDFLSEYVALCKAAMPLMRFVSRATSLEL